MTVRTEAELKACIAHIEECYPIEDSVGDNPIGNYCLGILAGLKMALGEYETFAEIDLTEFLKSTFKEG